MSEAPIRRGLRSIVLALLLAIAVSGSCGCGASAKRLAAQNHPSPRLTQRASHIAVIVMENEEYGDIIGSSSTPFINRLAGTWALARQMYAIRHPSLPNYLALTGGSTFGIDSDCTDCSVPGSGIAGQLSAAGRTWKGYMEGLPKPCFTGGGAGDYAKKHDPFLYYRAIVRDPRACRRVVPLGQLASDERAGRLPTLSWITPNLCHDMHDCDPAAGDRFLRRLVPPLLRALGPHGLLVVTFDEGSSDNGCCRLAAGGHIVTILAGGLARRGARLSTPVDHYSTLQTIEDLTRVPRQRGAACACTPSLGRLLVGSARRASG
jgi:phosphatidylinositol-3-phosphatase